MTQGETMGLEKPEGLISVVLAEVRSSRDELKDLIKSEIQELKDEHIADLRKGIERLADDQRRLWDSVGELQKREYERRGSHRIMQAMWGGVGTLIGAVAVIVAGLITRGH